MLGTPYCTPDRGPLVAVNGPGCLDLPTMTLYEMCCRLKDAVEEQVNNPELTWRQCIDRNCTNACVAEFLYQLHDSVAALEHWFMLIDLGLLKE